MSKPAKPAAAQEKPSTEGYDDFAGLADESAPEVTTDSEDSSEEVCDMAIDAALNSVGSNEDRREAFKRAVLKIMHLQAGG